MERARLGVAVSGGPDSLALLLLANAACPGRIEAATVDHGLRPESADEARFVAEFCEEIGVPHEILEVEVTSGNLQDEARKARYRALGEWHGSRGLVAVMTAHHADDQAETLLMRLNRGSGLSGLAGVRVAGVNPVSGGRLFRPLLGWRKADLEKIVADSGIDPVRDPSNEDDRFDRVRVRKALADNDWLEPESFAQSAALLAEADAALSDWVERVWADSISRDGEKLRVSPDPTLPREIKRRLLARALVELAGEPRGSQVAELLNALERGEGGNLAGVLVTSNDGEWRLRREPPRR